jgi:hypothetical protein
MSAEDYERVGVVEVPAHGKEPLTLLHLFFKRISDRNGFSTGGR